MINSTFFQSVLVFRKIVYTKALKEYMTSNKIYASFIPLESYGPEEQLLKICSFKSLISYQDKLE